MKEKIKTGGICGILHIALSVVIAFISLIDKSVIESALLWNVFIFNIPVFIDFTQSFFTAPEEKMSRKFKNWCWALWFILLGSSIILICCFGISSTIEDLSSNVVANYFLKTCNYILRYAFIVNPFAVSFDYVCNILIEETRTEETYITNNDKNMTGGAAHC